MSYSFTTNDLAWLWERATTLPATGRQEANGPLTNAIIREAIEGSDEGEYPLILETLDAIITDIQDFKKAITWAATYRYQPCREDYHENCVGELDGQEFDIPPFCTCPCHGDRREHIE